MPDAFEFTIPTPTIDLPADRSGSTVVDVTSRLDRHGRVRIEVLPGADADAGWFEDPEPTEFDLPSGQTLRVAVPIKVPPAATAGAYDFTVRASAVDDPQVDFTVSPTFALNVPEPPTPSGIPTWLFVVVGALVVAVLGLAAWFFLRSDPPPPFPAAPNLIGLSVTDAETQLDEQQSMRVYSEQADVSASCVFLQSPPPDSSTVSISVLAVPCPAPAPTVMVPDVLTGLCDNVTVNGFCRDVETFFGIEYAANPDWAKATDDMVIDFVERFTVEGVLVDSVVGRPIDQANDTLDAQGLPTVVVSDGSGGPECVYLQHPYPQKPVADGSTVTLVTTRCPAAADTADEVVLATPLAADWSDLCASVPEFCASVEATEVPADYFDSEEFATEMSSMVSAFRNRFTGDVVPEVVDSKLSAGLAALEDKGLEAAYALPAREPGQVTFLWCYTIVGQNPSAGTLIDNLDDRVVALNLEAYLCLDILVDEQILDGARVIDPGLFGSGS